MPFLVTQNPMNPPTYKNYLLRDDLSGKMINVFTGEHVFGLMPPGQLPNGWDGDPTAVNDPHLRIRKISEEDARARGWTPPDEPYDPKGRSNKNPIPMGVFVKNNGVCPGCDRQLHDRAELEAGKVIITSASPHPFYGRHTQAVCLARLTVAPPVRKIPSFTELQEVITIAEAQLVAIAELQKDPTLIAQRILLNDARRSSLRCARVAREALESGLYEDRIRAWEICNGKIDDRESRGETVKFKSGDAFGVIPPETGAFNSGLAFSASEINGARKLVLAAEKNAKEAKAAAEKLAAAKTEAKAKGVQTSAPSPAKKPAKKGGA